MLGRTSVVDKAKVFIVSYSSIFQIGDSHYIYKLSRALAVQREAEIFLGDEGNFAAFQTFTRPISPPPIDESISIAHHHLSPIIKVNNINIIGISSASMLNIGNSHHVAMEARIKHIRQLLPTGHEQDIG
ncbi:spore germination protein GerPE [Neobacillus sp. OS1-32]|uniref:spore germination protein GerPE n=1 Tax=Neobacillus sp. OS1-32 TaxID=3070682 RepID=UPI0027E1FAB6|nr:spore germination protein GerPE [Neobacillus sp. OS1-32]WML32114.1 spore germination protein GerPE [Neobacillus sp. OS1-32]